MLCSSFRQMAARSLLETLQQVSGSVDDTETVFRFMDQVASDRGKVLVNFLVIIK